MRNGSTQGILRVFKFGGNSVRDADSVRNVAKVLEHSMDDDLLIVVSAMGKTTNQLEELLDAWRANGDPQEILDRIRSDHQGIIDGLFHDNEAPVHGKVAELFQELEEMLASPPRSSYDAEYDRIVSFGELLSSLILSEFLELVGHPNHCFDARGLILTDGDHRRAHPDHAAIARQVNKELLPFFQKGAQGKRGITQGFIGSSGDRTTTLGREGSDHTAAILAYHLDAQDVTIWKDVPGVLNADPRYFEKPRKLERISYREAIEMSYYGAKVLHPRTVQPLQKKEIPLYVKSFLDPTDPGTCVGKGYEEAPSVPCYILKKDQVLLSIIPRDLSFVMETDLSHIFDRFANWGIAVNMMENSALHFSVSIDRNEKLPALLEELGDDYEVRYNTGLELLTVRHYDEKELEARTEGRTIYLEQRTRQMARFLME